MACLDTTVLLDLSGRGGRGSHARARRRIDALIAGVCLVQGHAILTRNTAHFAKVPGLRVETY